jgi:hypothetical protein
MAEGNFEVCEVIMKESGFHNITHGTNPDWLKGKIIRFEHIVDEFIIYLMDADHMIMKVSIAYASDEMLNFVLSLKAVNKRKAITLMIGGLITQSGVVIKPEGFDDIPRMKVIDDFLSTTAWEDYIDELVFKFLNK